MNKGLIKNEKQLQRMLNLSNIQTNKTTNNVELVKIGPDKKAYGVVKEGRKYIIKTSNKNSDLVDSDFEYIGGVQNKTKHQYESFSEAVKDLNFIFEGLNKEFGVINESNILLDEKRYVLRRPTPPKQEPSFEMEPTQPEPELDLGQESDSIGEPQATEDEPEFDLGSEMKQDGEEETDFSFDNSDEDIGDEEDPIKNIQKTTDQFWGIQFDP